MITQNLFELTPEQAETSKTMYNGKIIKCLVAPYHTYQQLEKMVPFTKTTYLFPERELTLHQLRSFISFMVANPQQEEFRIITTNQNIIMDMVDACVRVLTEDDRIVESPVKTFMANIHDIRYSLLENEDHRKVKTPVEPAGNKKVNALIEKLNSKKTITKAEYNSLLAEIDLIGEPVLVGPLKSMLNQLKIK
jgi:hypothetical protein